MDLGDGLKCGIIYTMQTEQLAKRIKSFLWRLSAVIAVMGVEFLADNIGLFGLSLEVQVVLGLILGEITKYLNTSQPKN